MNRSEKFQMDANIVRIFAYIGVIHILVGGVVPESPNYFIVGLGVLLVVVSFGLLKFWLRTEKYI